MAKDIITRFKLETTAFDSAIKKAAKELSDYSKTATQAKEGFNQFTKGNIEAAKALGTMAASTTNAKDRVKELVGAYNEAAKAYEALSDEQKKSDWAKALAGSLTTLQQRIKDAKQEMQGMGDSIKSSGLFGGGKLDGMLQVFGGNLMTKAAGMAMNFVNEMGDMVKQGIELAKAGEGVRIAFERLGRGDILDGLRQATHGTVTDLELMKAAVKFNDFKLPVEELGTMLAFAQQKAKDTGQSVDYMVDSIVTGLGRKSLMILDNLGLSATEIRDRMKDTGDMTKAVGAIIRDQMAAAGDYVETAADRAAQANVNLQNKMEELGRKFAPVEEASNQLWTSMKIGILDVVGGPLARLLNGLTEAGRLKNALNDINGGDGSGQSLSGKRLGVLRHYSGSQKGVTKQTVYDRTIARYTKEEEAAHRKAMEFRNKRLEAEKKLREVNPRRDEKGVQANYLKKSIDSLRSQEKEYETKAQAIRISRNEFEKGAKDILHPTKVNISTETAEQNVTSLTHKLKQLQKERAAAVKSGDKDKMNLLDKQINETRKEIKALDPKALSTGGGHKLSAKETAENRINNAEKAYSASMENAAIRLKKGIDDQLTYKKKELSAQERLFEAYGEAYATYKNPKYKENQEGMANKIASLTDEIEQETKAQTAQKEAARKLEAEQKKAADALAKRTALEESWKTPTLSSIGSLTQDITSRRSESAIGSAEFSSLSANLVDITSLNSIINTSLENGINIDPAVTQSIMQQIVSGTDIDDSVWEDLVEQINKQLAQLKLDPIQLDFKTGNIKKETKEMNDSWKSAAQAVQAVGGALSSIEDPAAKIMGTVAQAIATIALAYAEASLQAAKNPANAGWGWIAFAATGLATMFSTIAAVHSATGYANGGMIKGNTYSGDQLMAQGPDGGLIGLNAGEIVLNKAAQGNLASQLNDNSNATPRLVAEVSAEQIRFVIRNNRRRENISETALFR